MASEEEQNTDTLLRSRQQFCDGLLAEISTYEAALAKVNAERAIEENRDDPLSDRNVLKWHNVVEAVKQELYPFIATSLGKAVEELVESKALELHDLSDNATDLVIEKLKTKKVLFSKEIEYIKGLVQRARAFRWEESESTFLVHSLFPIQFNHSADSATLH